MTDELEAAFAFDEAFVHVSDARVRELIAHPEQTTPAEWRRCCAERWARRKVASGTPDERARAQAPLRRLAN